MLAKTLELAGVKICSNQLAASGGRIGFAEKVCGMEFVEQNEDAFMRKAGQSGDAAKLFKSGKIKPFLMRAKNWAKSNLGPAGWIGGEFLAIGLGGAWEMSQGKGWKEALDTWAGLGGHFGKAEDRLREIGAKQGWSDEQVADAMKIGQLMDVSNKYEQKSGELEQALETQDIGGTARVKYDPRLPGAYKPIQGKYQDPERLRELKAKVPELYEKGTELYEGIKDYPTSINLYEELQNRKKLEELNKRRELEHRFKSRPDYFGYEIDEQEPFYDLKYQKNPFEKPIMRWEPDFYESGGIVGLLKK
jgi:hypothetical protein